MLKCYNGFMILLWYDISTFLKQFTVGYGDSVLAQSVNKF